MNLYSIVDILFLNLYSIHFDQGKETFHSGDLLDLSGSLAAENNRLYDVANELLKCNAHASVKYSQSVKCEVRLVH